MSDDFVLDKADNPHPRMLAGARRARSRASDLAHAGSDTDAAHVAGFWDGYLAAMADATGCDPADLEAWMDRQ